MKLAFVACGRGPAVLLLHGLFASGRNWSGIARELSLTCRVYSVDLRNHGASPRALDMSYLAMAEDVLGLIEAEALQRPYVVGHGMGGKVAMALALSAPHAIAGLSVIDVAPLSYVDRLTHQMHSAIAALYRTPPSTAAADALLAQWLMPRVDRRHTYVDRRSHLPGIAVSLPVLSGFPPMVRHLRTELALQAVVGSRSDCVQPACRSLYAPMFPQARVEVIEGAGHWVHADRPRALVACLRRAIAATTGSAASALVDKAAPQQARACAAGGAGPASAHAGLGAPSALAWTARTLAGLQAQRRHP